MKNHLFALLSVLAFVAMSLLAPLDASANQGVNQNDPNLGETLSVDSDDVRAARTSLEANPAANAIDCPQCLNKLSSGTAICKGLHDQACIRPTGPAAQPGSVVPVKKSGTVQ